MKGDGIADNVIPLRCLLRDKCDALQLLSVPRCVESLRLSVACVSLAGGGDNGGAWTLYHLFAQLLYRGVNGPTRRRPVERPLGAEPRGEAR